MRTPFGKKTLGDFGFSPLLEALPLTCLDVGARGGFTKDLMPIAPAVRAIGFEPEQEECTKLNAEAKGEDQVWQSLSFVPVALGRAAETRRLHIYRKRGCTSLLEADAELASRFGRETYYVLDGTAEVPTTTADAAAQEYGFGDAAFFKLDVQGAELEILQGSQALLRDALVALRVEVSFLPIYRNQPLFAEIDQALRQHDFFPMKFLELHPWRRSSKAKLPALAEGSFPYSEGQMIHGDVLYLRNPESLDDTDDRAVERLLRAALLALTYGFVDHAMAIFNRTPVRAMLRDRFGVDAESSAAKLSAHLARGHSASFPGNLRSSVKKLIRGRP